MRVFEKKINRFKKKSCKITQHATHCMLGNLALFFCRLLIFFLKKRKSFMTVFVTSGKKMKVGQDYQTYFTLCMLGNLV